MKQKTSIFGPITALVLFSILISGVAFASTKTKVTIALSHDITSLNPFKAKQGQDNNVYMALYQPLFTHDTQTGESVPCLAESYKFSENNKDIFVKMRKDAKFHNGDPVTAQDVRFSWQQFIDEKNANAYARIFKSIKDIEVVDDYNFILQLRKVSADWKWLFHRLFVGSKKYYERVGEKIFAQNPIGSGPFQFVSRSIGERITLEAVNKHYAYPASFKTLEFVIVPDELTRMAMLEKGETDLIYSIPSQQVKRLKSNKAVTVKTAIVPSYYGLMFCSLNYSFLEDSNLRLAFNYGINRQEIVDKLFMGLAYPLYTFGSKAEVSYDPSIKYPYNPAKASELIKNSSFSPGTSIRLTYNSLVPNSAQVAEAIQGYMKELGVTIELRQMEVGTFLSLARKKSKDLGALIMSGWFGSQDPDVRLRMGARSNGVYVQVPGRKDVDQLIDEQHVTIDEDKRYKIINKIYRIFYEDPPYVPLFGLPMIYGISAKIDYTWVNKVNRLYNLWEIKIVN